MVKVRAIDVRPGDRVLGWDDQTVERVIGVVHGAGMVELAYETRSDAEYPSKTYRWASDWIELQP